MLKEKQKKSFEIYNYLIFYLVTRYLNLTIINNLIKQITISYCY